MKYDFYAELALGSDSGEIDQVVKHRERYTVLKDADWTTQAQILATGLCQKDMESLIKNGREEKKGLIQGYPGLLRSTKPFDLKELEKHFLPTKDSLNSLPDGSCLVQCDVTLERPFHSKDDRAFYPHENPLRRDWVFQTPCLAAAGLKGLLRWAWRARFGDENMEQEKTLFGPRNEGRKDGDALAGCLYTWPVFWKGGVAQEVINPHHRATGKGTQPIKFEVVGRGARASLWFLLFNRRLQEPAAFLSATLVPFLDALDLLLSHSGLSAKRAADWGAVSVSSPKAWLKGIAAPKQVETAAKDEKGETTLDWSLLEDSEGNLLPFDNPIYTRNNIEKFSGRKADKKFRDKALEVLRKNHEEYRAGKSAVADKAPPSEPRSAAIRALSAVSLENLKAEVAAALTGEN